ncbi:hypothetical protein CALCODRAFT_181449 [Calocera cornea HHB12733]|uniref:Uncharacterized protein n=1 Tax=Calocera cornea HHB12733 TaxID=1353952 RepID=A0A165HRP5_9BASI|nr:hypothetical protein CALCODRAFT_181449 [Calocera cornea HHB12733]
MARYADDPRLSLKRAHLAHTRKFPLSALPHARGSHATHRLDGRGGAGGHMVVGWLEMTMFRLIAGRAGEAPVNCCGAEGRREGGGGGAGCTCRSRPWAVGRRDASTRSTTTTRCLTLTVCKPTIKLRAPTRGSVGPQAARYWTAQGRPAVRRPPCDRRGLNLVAGWTGRDAGMDVPGLSEARRRVCVPVRTRTGLGRSAPQYFSGSGMSAHSERSWRC